MPRPAPASRAIPRWPTITATLDADGLARLTSDGRAEEDLDCADVAAARALVLEHVAAIAADLSRPVRLHCIDPDGRWELAVHPDGHVDELAAEPAHPAADETAAPRAAGVRASATPRGAPRPRRRLVARSAATLALALGLAGAAALALTNGPATLVADDPADAPRAYAPRETAPVMRYAAGRLPDDRLSLRAERAQRAALRRRVAARHARARRAAALRSARDAHSAAAIRRRVTARPRATSPVRPVPAVRSPQAGRITAATPPPARAGRPPMRPPARQAPVCGEFDLC